MLYNVTFKIEFIDDSNNIIAYDNNKFGLDSINRKSLTSYFSEFIDMAAKIDAQISYHKILVTMIIDKVVSTKVCPAIENKMAYKIEYDCKKSSYSYFSKKSKNIFDILIFRKSKLVSDSDTLFSSLYIDISDRNCSKKDKLLDDIKENQSIEHL